MELEHIMKRGFEEFVPENQKLEKIMERGFEEFIPEIVQKCYEDTLKKYEQRKQSFIQKNKKIVPHSAESFL